MIISRTSISTDLSGQEVKDHGLELFDLTTNEGDIQQYITGGIPAHWHHELEIFCLMEGEIQIGIGDTLHLVKAGEGCFINTGVLHSFTGVTPTPCIYRSFVFDSSIVSGTPGSVFDVMYIRPLLEMGTPFLKFEAIAENTPFFQLFDSAFTSSVDEQPGYEFHVREALSNILLFIKEKVKLTPMKKISSIQETRLKEILEWINQNLSETIKVEDIANSANISPRECQRIFSRYLHYSPMEYVRRRRILAAAEKLFRTNLPIIDIAMECGFSSHSHFSKQFRELVGSSPTEYRNAVQKANL